MVINTRLSILTCIYLLTVLTQVKNALNLISLATVENLIGLWSLAYHLLYTAYQHCFEITALGLVMLIDTYIESLLFVEEIC